MGAALLLSNYCLPLPSLQDDIPIFILGIRPHIPPLLPSPTQLLT